LKRILRGFWRKPPPWSAKRANRRIDDLVEVRLADIQAQLIRHVEIRAAASELAAENGARRLVERRGQIAADEAKSYADQGLGALGKSLAVTSRACVDSARRIEALERRVEQKIDAAKADELALAIERIGSRLDGVAARIQAVADALGALRQDAAMLREEHVAIGKEVGAAREDYVRRLGNLERDVCGIVVDYNNQLRNAEQRMEFVRSETLYELQASRYRDIAGAPRTPQAAKAAQIVNLTKLDDMRPNGLKLNVGCGHIQLDGYINVDGRALPGVDIVADATAIPLEPGAVAEIRSSHLVEHFTSHILDRVLLPHWSTLLKPGGVLTTVAPDGDAMLRAVNSGEMTFDDFKEVLFGGQDYDGDFHYNLVSPQSFARALERAGFVEITEEYSGKRNGKCFEFKILAKKPQ
jgi:hypothetical protein